MHMHEKIKFLQPMIQPVFHPVNPYICSCKIGLMQAVPHIAYKCLRNRQMHVRTVPAPCGVSDHSTEVMIAQESEHVISLLCYRKPFRVPHFQEELNILRQRSEESK